MISPQLPEALHANKNANPATVLKSGWHPGTASLPALARWSESAPHDNHFQNA
jgi:hypothetical protein